MNKINLVSHEWKRITKKINQSRGYRMIFSGAFNRMHYTQFLIQNYLYHHHLISACKNPELQNYSDLKDEHNRQILNDLDSVGFDFKKNKSLCAEISSTKDLGTFAKNLIKNEDSISYLGNLFHNESIFLKHGKDLVMGFEKKGISRNQMSFLCAQAFTDQPMVGTIRESIEQAAQTSYELDSIIYSAQSSAYLFGQLIDQILFPVNEDLAYSQI